MFRPSSEVEIAKLISTLRKSSNTVKFETNFYGFTSKKNNIFILNDLKGLFFLEKCLSTGMYIYYFFAKENEIFKADFTLPASKNYKCEYICNNKKSDAVLLHLNNLGFQKYAVLKKMSRINFSYSEEILDVSKCSSSDFSYIRYVFDNEFDKISERLPSNEKIIEALRSGEIFKVSKGGAALGFYWADTKKFLSELKYIYVDKVSRGQSLGEKLFQHYLSKSNNIKKNQLWVLEDNKPALALYEKYGFRFEQLCDYIFKVEK